MLDEAMQHMSQDAGKASSTARKLMQSVSAGTASASFPPNLVGGVVSAEGDGDSAASALTSQLVGALSLAATADRAEQEMELREEAEAAERAAGMKAAAATAPDTVKGGADDAQVKLKVSQVVDSAVLRFENSVASTQLELTH
eukprot:9491253-Pyramimonas_sp.AAC.1